MQSVPANIAAFFDTPTPDEWIREAGNRLPELLLDHANCELKAASTALGLIYRYPERSALVRRMSRLAREELRHFEQVRTIMEEMSSSTDATFRVLTWRIPRAARSGRLSTRRSTADDPTLALRDGTGEHRRRRPPARRRRRYGRCDRSAADSSRSGAAGAPLSFYNY